jgi:hypothetical protein
MSKRMAGLNVGIISESIVQHHDLKGITEAGESVIADAWLVTQLFSNLFYWSVPKKT